MGADTTSGNGQKDPKDPKTNKGFPFSDLRLIEPLANAGMVFSDMMGYTNTPTQFDYIPGFQPVSFKPLGDYIPETHFDTRYAANQAAQQAAATRGAIMQSTAPNRYANLLAADYNAQIANGNLLREAAMQDYNMMTARKQFNRGTNQYNSETGLKTSMANQDARLRYAQAALQQAKWNDDAANLASAARAQNASRLYKSIGSMGRESIDRGNLDMLIDSGVFGTISKKPYWWSDDRWNTYQSNVGAVSAAEGGKIKRKKKRGLTY